MAREDSFRIGSGRYLQSELVLSRLGEEIARLGNGALILAGQTALKETSALWEKSLGENGVRSETCVFRGHVTREIAADYAKLAKERGFEVVVGIGGGTLMDLAKLVAHDADARVICAPTSIATCAACAPLSVCYDAEGKICGSEHFPREVDAVLADSSVLIRQPMRLFFAGVFDAMSKEIEIRQNYREGDAEYPLGLDFAASLAARSGRVLRERVPACVEAMREGKTNRAAEEVFFACLAVTGAISGIARGWNQCALAHKFFDFTALLYPELTRRYLHGEIVGVGLLLQNHFNGTPEGNELLLDWMARYGLPASVSAIGLKNDEETFSVFYEKISHSSVLRHRPSEEHERFFDSLKYLFSL